MKFTQEQVAGLMPIYRMERRRLLTNAQVMRECRRQYGLRGPEVEQRELAQFRAAWRSVAMGAA